MSDFSFTDLPFEYPYRWPDMQEQALVEGERITFEQARQFEERDRALEDYLASLDGGGGAPTVVVAANNASDLSKSKADYVCDGSGDQVEIQAAADLIATSGGRILLTEGTFVGSGGVSFSSEFSLVGMGPWVTYLAVGDITIDGSEFLMSDLLIDGMIDATSGGVVDSFMTNVWIDTSSSSDPCFDATGQGLIDLVATGCWFVSNSGAGGEHGFDASYIQRCAFTGCTFYPSGYAINTTSSVDELTLTGNFVQVGSLLSANDADDTTISGNMLNDQRAGGVGAVIDLTGAASTNLTIASNTSRCTSSTRWFVDLADASTNFNIAGNTDASKGNSVRVGDDCTDFNISANQLGEFDIGVDCIDGTVTGNGASTGTVGATQTRVLVANNNLSTALTLGGANKGGGNHIAGTWT